MKVPFIDEVQEFNEVMGKCWQNRTTPTINPEDAKFVIDFIQEELDELKEAVETKISLHTLDGKRIEERVLSNLKKGENIFTRNMDNIKANGAYILSIETPYEKAKQIIVIRR